MVAEGDITFAHSAITLEQIVKKSEFVRSTRRSESEVSEVEDHRPRRKSTSKSLIEMISIDVLSVMSDDDLSSTYSDINSQRNSLLKSKSDTQYHEVELAYIQREMKIRASRRAEHRKYNDKLNKEVADFYAAEALLPEFVPNMPTEFN